MITMKCPAPDLLKSFYRGEIADEQSDQLVSHLSECSDCQASLNSSDDGQDWLIAQLRATDEDSRLDREDACELGILKALGALAVTEAIENRRSTEITDFPLLPATIGDYEILRSLGSGGMGRVYLARHGKLGRLVALKILANHRLADQRAIQRFESEMRAIGRLSHPNIVTAHDARDIDGRAVLVTEFIDGLDLGQLVLRTGPLPIAEACEIIRQVAEALAYTSEQGFVHRDVKPSNIMVSLAGDVKLLDLGLARLPVDEEDRAEITGTGQTMGTADYISPEQITDSRRVDVRSDIYSLGATFYKLLTGRAPFADDLHVSAFAKMTAHVSQSPTPIQSLRRDLPSDLAQLIEAMLQKRPDDRPQRPSQIAESLSAWCQPANLKHVIDRALLIDPQVAQTSVVTNTLAGSILPQPFVTPPRNNFKAIAAGFFGLLVGLAMGIIIAITNPDGTRSFLHLAEGSKVEISQANSATDTQSNKGQSPAAESTNIRTSRGQLGAASRFDPLQFVLLVSPESSGKKPSIPDHQVNALLEQLHRTNSEALVGSRNAMFIPIANESTGEIPISAWNNGIRFALVTTDREYSIPWSDIQGNLLSVEKIVDSTRSESQLQLEFTEVLGQKLESLTKSALGQSLGIVADGRLIQAPKLVTPIQASAIITGRFPEKVVNQLLENLAEAVKRKSQPGAPQPEANGFLQPVVQSQVFAHIDGEVEEVKVDHGVEVKAGDLLVKLRNRDLEIEITRLEGQAQEAIESIASLNDQISDANSSNRKKRADHLKLLAQLSETQNRLDAFRAQLQFHYENRKKLEVVSPIDGVVMTRDLKKNLLGRPVARGQVLVTVADARGEIQVEPSAITSVTVPAETVIVESYNIDLFPLLDALQPYLTEIRQPALDANTFDRLASRLAEGFGMPPERKPAAAKALSAVWPIRSVQKAQKGVRPELSWIAADPSNFFCFTFSVIPSLLYADMISFAEGWNGNQAIIKDVLSGLEKDPNGPQINVERDLFAHFGVELVVDASVPLVAIQLKSPDAIRPIVIRNTFDGNFRVIGDYLMLGTRKSLDAAQTRFDKDNQRAFEP